jgi:Na+/H+-dicarboxylate symporter
MVGERRTRGLSSSGLVDPVPFPLHPASAFSTVSSQKPIRALRQAIQDLYFNITVGMLSPAPELVYAQAATVIAEIRTTENIWTYDWRVLVATYAIAALLCLVSWLAFTPCRLTAGAGTLGS